jgi:hypothetical protein
MEKLDSKKVRTFLSELNSTEFRYLELTVQMVSSFDNLIKRYKLDKERFCELFHIKPTKYVNYIKGNFNYTIDDMATLNAVYQQLETERIKQEEQIKIATEKYD